MKIYIYENVLDNLTKKFLLKYDKIFLNNEDIVKIMKIYYNNIKLSLSNEKLFEDIFKRYNIKNKILLIKVENYDKVIEFKNILSKYHLVFLLNEKDYFIDSKIVDKHFELITKNMILSERIENITEKDSIFKQILNINIDNIYCLTYKDSEKKKNIISQMNKMDSSIEFINLSNKNLYEENKLEGYKYCLNDSKRKGYKNILVLLEDNEFNYNNFYRHLRMKNDLDNFDLIFLSGKLFDGHIYNNKYLKVNTIQDSCSVIINERCYDYILKNIDSKWERLDIWNNRTEIERQIKWSKRKFDNFITKFVCQKRGNSYFLNPLLSYKGDSIDNENRIITYQEIMERLCLISSRKYIKNFDVFCISDEKKQQDVKLLQDNPIFLSFNICERRKEYDYVKEDKLKRVNVYGVRGDIE